MSDDADFQRPADPLAWLATVSRSEQRKHTMLQHPIFLYQVVHSTEVDDTDDERRYAIDWITDRVFATESEARDYGVSNRHNDGEENKGWRIYSVPAAGALRAVLEKATAP